MCLTVAFIDILSLTVSLF